MRYYLKSGRRAALMLFRRGSDADFDRADRIEEHNRGIMQGIFSGLMQGTISAAHITAGAHLDVYTKSLRGDYVQVSHFCKLRGVWEACSHSDAHSVEDLTRDLKTGRYINIH